MALNKRLAAATLAAVIGMAMPLISHYEGLSTQTYRDPVGIPTICYGHTGRDVKPGQTLSQADCDRLLAGDLGQTLQDIDRMVTVPLPVERRAALASFAYNAGTGQLARSSLLAKLNAGDTAGACAEFSRWVYAGGKKLPGLVARRQSERELCEVGL